MKITGSSFFLLLLALPMVCVGSQKSKQFFLCPAAQEINHKPEEDKTKLAVPRPYYYQLVARYPHDTSAFTQGLVFYKEMLYESTGLLGKSEVRKININNGKVLLKTHLSDIYFGEGVSVLNHLIVQMSWKIGKIFFFHPETLELIKKMNFDNDVWGSTTMNEQLLISNGSSNIFFISPETLSIKKTLNVTLNSKEVVGLNELEYADGYIYANVWPSHCIVKVDPDTGKVVGWINLSKLYPDSDEQSMPESAVLNGIAYDKQKQHFFVTGKFWPYLYEIKWQSNEN